MLRRAEERGVPLPQKRKAGTEWMNLSGVGIEFAAAVVGFTLAGYWWDRYFGTGPWGLLIGVALGLIGGTYNLIRQSLSATRESGRGTTNGDGES
jgi:F0F1-type ATP synthase assembly protein I